MLVTNPNIISDLETWALHTPDAAAIITPSKTLTHSELWREVTLLGASLHEQGLPPNQVVATDFSDELTELIATLAIVRIGATVLPLAHHRSEHLRQHACSASCAAFFITDKDYITSNNLALLKVRAPSIEPPIPAWKPAPPCQSPGPMFVCIGSGSSGRKKLFFVGHDEMRTRVLYRGEVVKLGPDDRFLSLCAISYLSTQMRALAALHAGGSIALGYRIENNLISICQRFQITYLFGVVVQLEHFVRQCPHSVASSLNSIRYLETAASSVSDNLRKRLMELISPRLYITYGTNETGSICIATPEDILAFPGTVGQTLAGGDVEIVSSDGTPLPADTTGEIRYRKENMMSSYIDDDEATRKAFRDGWFYPGDMGRLTTNGQLIHLGRTDGMMIMNGINIYPSEIEQAMKSHPCVDDAIAKSFKHLIHQDIPICLVTLKEGRQAGEMMLKAYGREHLGTTAPARVFIVAGIPRTPQGKVLSKEVDALITARLSGELRQPFTKRNVIFSLPAAFQPTSVDNWLNNVLFNEIDIANKRDRPPHAWLKRSLILTRLLLQICRLPVFDMPRIHSLQQNGRSGSGYSAVITLPKVNNIPDNVYKRTIKHAFQLIAWMHGREITNQSREKLFSVIENEIRKPTAKLLGQGKSSYPMLLAAYEKRIPFYHIGHGRYQLGWGAKARWFSRSSVEGDAAIGMLTSGNKLLTAQTLRSAGLPAPKHDSTKTVEGALSIATQLQWPVVIKPMDGERGEGVTVGIDSETKLTEAFQHAAKHSRRKVVIVEEEVPGVCHRLFFVRGRLLYGVKRWPMAVFGDGSTPVKELVSREVNYQETLAPWCQSEIRPLDSLALTTLKDQGLTPDSIPEVGERVTLRPIESTEWGGVDEDVSEHIHPDNLAIARAAATLFRLEVAGVDIISEDISVPWHKNGAIINEVNYSPLLGGAPISRRAIPKYLDALVQGDGRIPVEIFIGGESAWQAAIDRQEQLGTAGVPAHVTSHKRTITPEGSEIVLPQPTLEARVTALLLNRSVEAILINVQTDEILHKSLPIDWADSVTVVDHQIVSHLNTASFLAKDQVEHVIRQVNEYVTIK